MNHFFIDPNYIDSDMVRFPTEISHQICRVLRLKENEHVMVLDNSGQQYEVNLVEIDLKHCVGEILTKGDNTAEPKCELHLFIAMTQREKFEWVLQKCCELGVSKFTPLLTERTIVTSVKDFPKKKERWERILKEAAEQSRRGKIPTLFEPMHFSQAVIAKGECKLIAWEKEETRKLDDFITSSAETAVFLMIGPEGGFSENEVDISIQNKWYPFSLGKRILRMETAAIVATTLVMNAKREM